MSGLRDAQALDDNDSDVHRILAASAINTNDLDRAAFHQERALGLNPNDDLIVVQQGELLTWLGEAEQGVEWIKRAMRLNPFHPARFWSHLGRAYFVARRYAEAQDALRRLTSPDAGQLALLAACAAQLEQPAVAAAHTAAALARDANVSIGRILGNVHLRRAEDREHYRAALLKAGLPA